MLSNKQISSWMVSLTVVLSISCQTYTIPTAYDKPYSEIKEDPYGCWSEFELRNSDSKVSGELICMERDSVYVLVFDQRVQAIEAAQIAGYKIYTYKNQSGRYGRYSLLYLIPSVVGAFIHSDYFGEFLFLGTPVGVVGLTHMIIEGSNKKNVITANNTIRLHEISKYARYPGGKPIGVDLNQLLWKK